MVNQFLCDAFSIFLSINSCYYAALGGCLIQDNPLVFSAYVFPMTDYDFHILGSRKVFKRIHSLFRFHPSLLVSSGCPGGLDERADTQSRTIQMGSGEI